MKVKTLISKLKELPPDADVKIMFSFDENDFTRKIMRILENKKDNEVYIET